MSETLFPWWLVLPLAVVLVELSSAAIVPPPWANPKINPCALLPSGWQMLFWPADGRCYRIFQMGHPCPPTMELTPGRIGSGVPAECNCPPGTIRTPDSNDCHAIFTKGPCSKGQYFAPNSTKAALASRLGYCTEPESCSDPTQIFWPQDGRCYRRFSKGPCVPGLIVFTGPDGVAVCGCDRNGIYAHELDGRCYELYSKGPCAPGAIFLPGGRCGCTTELPHYDINTKACYEIGSIGPCRAGHRFSMPSEGVARRASCRCKPGYELEASVTGVCHRLYTRGPCGADEMFVEGSRCVRLPCPARTRLYYPADGKCYRIGTRGPCADGEVVVFDFDARPSVDGLAYNAVCGCADTLAIDKPQRGCSIKSSQGSSSTLEKCGLAPGTVVVGDACHALYTRGPCRDGQWLVPAEGHKGDKTISSRETRSGKLPSGPTSPALCVCKPGYVRHSAGTREDGAPKETCLPPTVSLARYLDEKYNGAGGQGGAASKGR